MEKDLRPFTVALPRECSWRGEGQGGNSFYIHIFLDCLTVFAVGNLKNPIKAKKQNKTQITLTSVGRKCHKGILGGWWDGKSLHGRVSHVISQRLSFLICIMGSMGSGLMGSLGEMGWWRLSPGCTVGQYRKHS